MTTKLNRAASLMRHYQHQGIEYFWDIEGITEDAEALRAVIDHLINYSKDQNIDYVVGFDARGFLFGGAIAHGLNAGFKQIRKKGKLPGPVVAQSYQYEYSAGTLELQDNKVLNGKRVLLVDDVFATGGTARAGIDLVNQLGGIVVEFVSIIEMPELNGRLKLMDVPTHSCISIINNVPLVGVEYCVDMFTRESEEGQLVLINRLTKPHGYAMPGGRIEPHESPLVAAVRELREEIGMNRVCLGATHMLTTAERDPRGPKVSVVFDCIGRPTDLRGEVGATEVFMVETPADLPPPEVFAFDHGSFVHKYWPTVITEENTIQVLP